METVGVEAVVKGLQAFLGDMKKVNSALDGLRPSGTLLQQMFESVGSAVSNFGSSVARVVETALGVMLRDAIEFIIGKLRDLIAAIIETGSQFQLLKIRLTGLNLNEFADGTRSFADAMAMAGQKTQEEITWLQTLGAQTPFDPAQIADTYTQARAFGFAADEAKRLTTDIINYTAGMGLSNETLFLVIQNLGQMVQRGKITGTEIRDLARGSFLPLSDVLERIAKNMGMTVKELTKKISTPEGIPAQEFVKAFEQMVEEEPRFVGAAGRMSRALVPAAMNVKELFTSIFGLNVVTPVFDILGEKVAGLVDQFVYFNEQGDLIKTDVWNNLVAAATNLGIAIGEVIKKLLAFLPTGRSLAEGLVNAIQGVAVWIRNNQDRIVGFFVSIANAVNTWVIVPFQRISAWVAENWSTITAFFQSLGEIIATVFGRLFGGAFAKGDFLGGVLDAIKIFMQYVTENKDQIATWITAFIRVVAVIEVVLTVFNILIGVVAAVVGFFVSLIGVVAAVAAILPILMTPITLIIVGLLGIGASLAGLVIWFATRWDQISAIMSNFFNTVYALYKYFQTQFSSEPDYMNDWLTQLPINMQGTAAAVGEWMEVVRGRWDEGMASIEARNKRMLDSVTKDLGDLGLLFTNFPAALQPMIEGFNQAVPAVEIVIRKFRLAFTFFVDDIRKIDWAGLGRSITSGIANGISSGTQSIINAAVHAAQAAYQAAMHFLQGGSPSKLFEQVGVWTMQGFAQGIEKYAGVASRTMTTAMRQVTVPAMTMPGIIQSVVAQAAGNTTNNNSTSNYNLTVNSGASAEPVVQDFNMLASLAGA